MSRVPVTSENKAIVALWPTEGSRKTVLTHDWSDPTTWYQKSTRVEGEILSPIVSGTTYAFANSDVIDLYHGKVWEEDGVTDGQGRPYRVEIGTSISGSGWQLKTEVDPHTNTGDYTVNYSDGEITFTSSLDPETAVSGTYYYSTGTGRSEFTVKPTAGKALKLVSAEVQFSKDIVLTDTTVFKTYGYVEVFAPQLAQSNGGPLPDGTQIEIQRTTYKTMRDFMNESNGARPEFPGLGGSGWRGLNTPVVVFQWDYAALLSLKSQYGMELRVSLEHDEPMGGEYATATLYALSEEE